MTATYQSKIDYCWATNNLGDQLITLLDWNLWSQQYPVYWSSTIRSVSDSYRLNIIDRNYNYLFLSI